MDADARELLGEFGDLVEHQGDEGADDDNDSCAEKTSQDVGQRFTRACFGDEKS